VNRLSAHERLSIIHMELGQTSVGPASSRISRLAPLCPNFDREFCFKARNLIRVSNRFVSYLFRCAHPHYWSPLLAPPTFAYSLAVCSGQRQTSSEMQELKSQRDRRKREVMTAHATRQTRASRSRKLALSCLKVTPRLFLVDPRLNWRVEQDWRTLAERVCRVSVVRLSTVVVFHRRFCSPRQIQFNLSKRKHKICS
jgi:hypothetical protein